MRRNLGTKMPMINGCRFSGCKRYMGKPTSESKKGWKYEYESLVHYV